MAVSGRVSRNRKFLRRLAQTHTRKERRDVLEHCGREPIVCCVEILCNFLAKKFALPKKDLRMLKPHAPDIRRISTYRSVAKARRALIGRGSFLPQLLIPILASLVTSAVKHVVGSAIQARANNRSRNAGASSGNALTGEGEKKAVATNSRGCGKEEKCYP
jgi:hypothetical protein